VRNVNILYDIGIKKPIDMNTVSKLDVDKIRLRVSDLNKKERIWIDPKTIIINSTVLSGYFQVIYDIYLKILDDNDLDVECLNIEDIINKSRSTVLRGKKNFIIFMVFFRQKTFKFFYSFLIPPQFWYKIPELN
jgi:hypothetical protein